MMEDILKRLKRQVKNRQKDLFNTVDYAFTKLSDRERKLIIAQYCADCGKHIDDCQCSTSS